MFYNFSREFFKKAIWYEALAEAPALSFMLSYIGAFCKAIRNFN